MAGDDPSVLCGKPGPDIYLEAARRLGFDPARCLVFEDAESGVRSAKAAGCGGIVAVPDPRTAHKGERFLSFGADEILDDLRCFDGRGWGIDLNMRE